MFNITEVAKIIRNARIDKNLTQMNVADALCVSYQAVSNWERGISMPDISKLGELSTLLGISIEDMLGHTPDGITIKKILQSDNCENVDVSLPEIADVVPILPPAMTEELVNNAEKTQTITIFQLTALAPFLSRKTVDRLAQKITVDNIEDLMGIAPFVSREVLERMCMDL